MLVESVHRRCSRVILAVFASTIESNFDSTGPPGNAALAPLGAPPYRDSDQVRFNTASQPRGTHTRYLPASVIRGPRRNRCRCAACAGTARHGTARGALEAPQIEGDGEEEEDEVGEG